MSKYIYTATKINFTKFYKTTLPSDMILTTYYVFTSDEKVENLNWEFKIHYRAFIGPLIYLLYTRIYLSFAEQKLEKFLSNPSKVYFEGLVHLLK